MGYESSAERWSPVQSVEKILLSVVSMLAGLYGQLIISRKKTWSAFSTDNDFVFLAIYFCV